MILAVAPHAARAQNLTWSPTAENSGGTGTWTTNPADLQWFNGTILLSWDNAAGTSATFGGAAGTVTVGEPITVQNISFATDGYRIEGGTLTFFGPAGANSTISANTGVTGTIDPVLAGVAGLIKAGPGMLVLTGPNTYSGGTTITAGTLAIFDNANLGAPTGALTLNGGTLLTEAAVTTSRAISLPATIGNGFINNGGSTDTFSGPITGPGSLTLSGSGTNTLNGALSMVGSLTLNGGTTILANAANTYLGGTTINGGTLSISNNTNLGTAGTPLTINSGTLATTATLSTGRPLTIAGGATFDVASGTIFTLSSAITATNGGTLPITKTNTAGTLQLSGSNTVSGNITVGGGTLEFLTGTSTYSGVISGAGALKQTSGTTTLNNPGNSYTGGTTVGGGNLIINTGTTGTDSVLGTGSLSITGGTLSPQTSFTSSRAISITGTPNIAVTGGQTIMLDGVISGTGQFRLTGGAAVLNAANTYTGGTLIQGSTGTGLSIANPGNLGVGGTLTFNNGILTTLNGMTLSKPVTLNANTNATFNIAAGTTLNMTGAFSSAGAGPPPTGNIVKSTGTGTLELSGANTNVGNVTVNAGELDLNTPIAGSSYLGTISGAGVIAFTGPGTTVLTGTLTSATGQVRTIGAGTVQIGDGNTGTLAGNITNNASLVFNTPQPSYAGAISGSGSVTKTNGNLLTLTGNNTYTGLTAVNAGQLFINSGGAINSSLGGVTVASGATLGGNGTIAGNVTVANGGGLTPSPNPIPPPSGSGIGTGVAAGTLNINGDLTLSSGSVLTYALGQAGAVGGLNSLVVVGGHLTLDGDLRVFTTDGGSFGPGIYRLFNYTGGLTNNGLNIVSAPAPLADLSITTAVANQVSLVNETPVPTMTFWDGSATGNHNNGRIDGGDGTWTAATADLSWTDSAGNVNGPWPTNDIAVFTGTRGTVTVDNSAGAVVFSGAQFAVDGYVITGGPLTTFQPNTEIRVGDGSALGAGMTATIASVIQGLGGINKNDLGTLILTGDNTYTGGTAITAGTLQLGNGGTTGSVIGNIVDGFTTGPSPLPPAALVFDLSGTQTFGGVVSGRGTLTQAGPGTLILTGANTYTGGTIIDSGSTLQVGSGNIVPGGAITDNGTLIFNFDTTSVPATLNYNGVIIGDG